jgi:MoaA/NifB/PqqE/SkfB family radical SAM enzyme
MIRYGIDSGIDEMIFGRLSLVNENGQALAITDTVMLFSTIEQARRLSENKIKTNLDQFTEGIIGNMNDFLPHHKKEIACYQPWIEMTIDTLGNAGICCNALHTLGNVENESLENIWYGDTYNDLRKKWVQCGILESCRNCDLDFQQSRNTINSQLAVL